MGVVCNTACDEKLGCVTVCNLGPLQRDQGSKRDQAEKIFLERKTAAFNAVNLRAKNSAGSGTDFSKRANSQFNKMSKRKAP